MSDVSVKSFFISCRANTTTTLWALQETVMDYSEIIFQALSYYAELRPQEGNFVHSKNGLANGRFF